MHDQRDVPPPAAHQLTFLLAQHHSYKNTLVLPVRHTCCVSLSLFPASPADNAIQSFVAPPSNPLQRVWGHFHCDPELDDDECKQPCHWSKKDGKKSASYSCAMSGTAIATGKYGAIMFDKDGNKYDWEYSNGHMHQVKSSEEYDEEPYEGESYEEEEEYDH